MDLNGNFAELAGRSDFPVAVLALIFRRQPELNHHREFDGHPSAWPGTSTLRIIPSSRITTWRMTFPRLRFWIRNRFDAFRAPARAERRLTFWGTQMVPRPSK